MEETYEIHLDNLKGKATLIDSTGWDCKYRIEAENIFMVVKQNYTKAPQYELVSHGENISFEKATEQMPIVMRQVYMLIMKKRPKPPQRYR